MPAGLHTSEVARQATLDCGSRVHVCRRRMLRRGGGAAALTRGYLPADVRDRDRTIGEGVKLLVLVRGLLRIPCPDGVL